MEELWTPLYRDKTRESHSIMGRRKHNSVFFQRLVQQKLKAKAFQFLNKLKLVVMITMDIERNVLCKRVMKRVDGGSTHEKNCVLYECDFQLKVL